MNLTDVVMRKAQAILDKHEFKIPTVMINGEEHYVFYYEGIEFRAKKNVFESKKGDNDET